MMKVIDMGSCIAKKKKRSLERGITMYRKLVDELQKNPAEAYGVRDAEKLADHVLEVSGYGELIGPTPVVEIAKNFGFAAFQEINIPDGISGNIFIGGTTESIYNADRVIVVGAKEEYFHQRFIVAHELVYYLMDYLGSESSQNPAILFSRAYTESGHDSPEEVRADRFAAELLMPADRFCRQYVKVMRASGFNIRYTLAYLSDYFETKKSSIERRIEEVIM